LMSVLNSSTSFDPAFWLDYKTGNHYFVGVTYKEADINSLASLLTVPVTGARNGNDTSNPVQLQDLVGEPKMTTSAVEVNHLALTRVIDVYANVQGRDIGSVAGDIERLLSRWGKKGEAVEGSVSRWAVPDPKKPGEALPGYTVKMRGEVASMR